MKDALRGSLTAARNIEGHEEHEDHKILRDVVFFVVEFGVPPLEGACPKPRRFSGSIRHLPF